MSKRKILLLAMSVIMIAILAVGGTLAYFTSEDAEDNVFTMGNVEIELEETFVQNSNLMPGLDINKDVWVENTGSNDAYTRVHIAIPTVMDDGNPSFAAVNNFLHFNFTKDSIADGQWSWNKTVNGKNYPGTGSDEWNFYTDTIDGVEYNIYVVTYETALQPGAKTATNAMDKVYLDKTVDAEAIKDENGKVVGYKYFDTNGNEFELRGVDENGYVSVKIKVFAEATQTATFTDAFNALDTAFGAPTSAGYVSPWNQ